MDRRLQIWLIPFGVATSISVAKPRQQVQVITAGMYAALRVLFGHHGTPAAGGGTRKSFFLRCFILLVLLPTIGYFEPPLYAQQPKQQVSYEGQKVVTLDLVAKPNTDVEALRPLVMQKAGEPYSSEKVQSSVAALQGTGRFSKIDVEVTLEAAGLRVMFVMQPAYYIGMIYFPGALEAFSYPRLFQVVNYPAQEPYQESRVKAAKPALLGFFTNNGYFAAEVQSETKLDEAHQLADLVFQVTLNQRAKFGHVEVTGLPAGEAARLKRGLRSFRARLKGTSLKEGKRYDPERLQAAAIFIRNYLSKENRLASQVRLEQPKYDPETNRADVTFRVTPGPGGLGPGSRRPRLEEDRAETDSYLRGERV